MVFSFLILFTWVMFSGVGGFGYQNWDFHGRNAIFRDLINHSWPVRYDYSADSAMQENYRKHGGIGLLLYLLAAFCAGWKASRLENSQFCIIYLDISRCILMHYPDDPLYRKAKYPDCAGVYFFWRPGFSWFGFLKLNSFVSNAYVGNIFSAHKFLSGIFFWILSSRIWMGRAYYALTNLEYHSFTSQLFWVFNQAVPAWVVTLLIINMKEKRSLFFTVRTPFIFWAITRIRNYPFYSIQDIRTQLESS